MKVEDLQDALNLVEDDFIEKVETLRSKKKRRNNWAKWISLAACLCCCFLVVFVANSSFDTENEENFPEKNTQESGKIENENMEETEVVQETEVEVVQGTEEVSEEINSIKIPHFSYEKEKREWLKDNNGNIIEEGFQNTEKIEVTDRLMAIELAKVECTIEYNQVDVEYDELTDIWKVTFSTTGVVGNCQTVYLSGEGITDLIVYGE